MTPQQQWEKYRSQLIKYLHDVDGYTRSLNSVQALDEDEIGPGSNPPLPPPPPPPHPHG